MIFIGHILQNCRGAYELKYFLRMDFINGKIFFALICCVKLRYVFHVVVFIQVEIRVMMSLFSTIYFKQERLWKHS